MSRRNTRRRAIPEVRVPIQEQLLIDVLPEVSERRILCTSTGRAQFAAAAAEAHPDAQVTCHFLDIYFADQARAAVPESVSIVCSADLPNAEFDLVAFPLKSRGEAELTHEMLQAGYLALREGGRMLASTDAPHDSWLHEQLRAMFPKVTREPEKKKGVRYLATKAGPLKKIKHFESEFAFRDQGRLIQAISRPGVFSHRRIDAGARTLINTMEVGEGFRVLDIGCGSGVVGLAAAFRAPGVSVLAVDSNARAIQCTERGAALNGLQTISTLLNAEGECDVPGTFDLAVGNPPYFSNYTIADIFLQAALRALKPGGQVLIVTKTPHWFEERMPQLFDDVQSTVAKNYYIVFSGRQRGDAAEA